MPREVSFRRAPFPLASAPPGPPILVSAVYDPGAVPVPTLTLVFDRAIDVSGYDGTEILLYDGPGGNIYDAKPREMRWPMRSRWLCSCR